MEVRWEFAVFWTRYAVGKYRIFKTSCFKISKQEDVFLVFFNTEKGWLDIWSGRLGKKFGELRMPEKGHGQLVSSDGESTVSCFYLFDGNNIWFF